MKETQEQTVPVRRLRDDLAFLDIVTEWDSLSGYHQWKAAAVVPATFRPRPVERYVIAVANQKGGVGKTITSLELGLAMVARGKRVRIINADPQEASLTSWVPALYPADVAEADRYTLTDVYYERCTLAQATWSTRYEGLFVVPSHPDLATVEKEVPTGAETCLRYHLREVEDDFDVTIIDSGPSLGLLSVSGLVAAHDVVIPVQAASALDIKGAVALYATIHRVQSRMNRDLRVAAVVLTDFERSSLAREIGAEMAKAFPDALIIPARTCVDIGKAQMKQQALREFSPNATAVQDYDQGAGVLVEGRAA
ncbi:AAA family ATPase [Streptomyces sp. NBC_01568]|uniref:ParA family protein n=1 Tax=Streptomyces sp. NBC_01568 TaxID=2975882 RepID=UPI002F914511